MRSFGMTVAVAVVGLLFFTQFAQAASDEAVLQEMQDRIANLESQIENEKASFLPSRSDVKNSLSSMLENTSIDGWAAVSYNYNFEGFDGTATNGGGGGGGNSNTFGQFESTNSFQLDQVVISIDNAATEDSRAGVHVEFEMGQANSSGSDPGLTPSLYSAYLSYLAPVGDGVNLDIGLMPTMLGAEVVQTTENFNITRGLVWGLQPITNVGAVLSTDLMGFGLAIGILNDTRVTGSNDINNEKAVTAQVSYGGDNWTSAFSMVWGDFAGVDVGTYDFLLTCDGIDNVSVWLDYTLLDVDDIVQVHGIALAARMALSDEMGVALRGEVTVIDPDNGKSDNAYSVTVTGDYALTDHLTAKAEVRVDIDADTFPGSDGTPFDEDVTALIIAQLIYTF